MSSDKVIDAAFLALNEEVGLHVWRIEQFNVVPWTDIGAFYTGDSYIVYWGHTQGRSQRVIRDGFFWIGTESTQDEFGTAAMKVVELDDRFNGTVTIHREVQDHESQEFMGLFDDFGGVRYMDGGTPSGFKSIDPENGTQLFMVKGRRNPVLLQVVPNAKSLNHGDAFIAVSTKLIVLWIGKQANPFEKMRACAVADKYKGKYGKAKFVRLDDSNTSPELWEALGGEGPIADAADGGNDAQAEADNVIKIFKAEGENFTKVAEGSKGMRAKLATDGISVILRGESVFVYCGAGVPAEQSKHGVELGAKFLEAQSLPKWYSMTFCKEGGVECEALDIIFAGDK